MLYVPFLIAMKGYKVWSCLSPEDKQRLLARAGLTGAAPPAGTANRTRSTPKLVNKG